MMIEHGPVTMPDALPEVTISEAGGVRYLHLGTEWIQGAMRMARPDAIELEYVRRMMAWLLFVEPDSVPGRHAMQLGLGAGAITRFCHGTLGMRCTALEINAGVVRVCRGWFALPPDDARLRVLNVDALAEIERPAWHGSVDALALDMYDDDAATPVLDSVEGYRACRRLLAEDGCLTVNLFGRRASFDHSLARIVAAFGAPAVWCFRPTRPGNTIVLAQRTASRPAPGQLRERARVAERRWGLGGARRWPRLMQPVEK